MAPANDRLEGRFETLLPAIGHRPHLALGLVPPADLDISVLGQLAPAQLSLSDTLEPGAAGGSTPRRIARGWAARTGAVGTRGEGRG
jgi:hypothetical protein